MLFKAVTETQDGALVRQAAKLFKLCKLTVQRRVKEGFLHAGVRQGEPLLHEVNAQHGLQRKRWPASLAFRVIRGDEFNQRGPRNDLFHLLQEHLLACFFGVQVEVQAGLFHGLNFLRRVLRQAHRTGSYAEFP